MSSRKTERKKILSRLEKLGLDEKVVEFVFRDGSEEEVKYRSLNRDGKEYILYSKAKINGNDNINTIRKVYLEDLIYLRVKETGQKLSLMAFSGRLMHTKDENHNF